MFNNFLVGGSKPMLNFNTELDTGYYTIYGNCTNSPFDNTSAVYGFLIVFNWGGYLLQITASSINASTYPQHRIAWRGGVKSNGIWSYSNWAYLTQE